MSDPQKTKNDVAWEQLFEKHHILKTIDDRGQARIASSAINEFREARLMTKFDHESNLPLLFQQHDLTILPITRGEYIIARMQAYHRIGDVADNGIIYMDFPPYIESAEYSNITSESTAINCAYISGIIAHFLDEEELLPTVSGRMSSGTFDFSILSGKDGGNLFIDVNNSQVEIDGGYEGYNKLALIEAKVSLASDFLIRQLYYPYRLWKERVSKNVEPIFLIYSNALFHLYHYQFTSPKQYNSIQLMKYQRYSLEARDIELADIQSVLYSTESIEEPDAPFPQADLFERIINLCELLFDAGKISQEDVTTTYDFDVRQTKYYADAGRYLGLIERVDDDGVSYVLTGEGRSLLVRSYKERQLGLVRAILRHHVFAAGLRLYLEKGESPTRDEIVSIMKNGNLYRVKADTTFRRRASTVLSWIGWILSLTRR